jgi:hypothetical protein
LLIPWLLSRRLLPVGSLLLGRALLRLSLRPRLHRGVLSEVALLLFLRCLTGLLLGDEARGQELVAQRTIHALRATADQVESSASVSGLPTS